MSNNFNSMQLVATRGVCDLMERDKGFNAFITQCLGRYANCDWGDTCDEDKRSNDYAVNHDERILAVYKYAPTDTTIWIITEWDRSATTILFPSEY